jgi:hypothetical protein
MFIPLTLYTASGNVLTGVGLDKAPGNRVTLARNAFQAFLLYGIDAVAL